MSTSRVPPGRPNVRVTFVRVDSGDRDRTAAAGATDPVEHRPPAAGLHAPASGEDPPAGETPAAAYVPSAAADVPPAAAWEDPVAEETATRTPAAEGEPHRVKSAAQPVKAAPRAAGRDPSGQAAVLQLILPPEATGTVEVPYVVRPGDTLSRIALTFGVPLARLRQANPEVREDRIFVGQILAIPLREPLLPPVRPAFVAIVAGSGDTFASLGARFGVSAAAVAAANPLLPPERVRAGTVVFVPVAEGLGSAGLPSVPYVVQRGDTLSAIASAFGVSLDALRRANPQVAGDAIFPGEFLAIPTGGVPLQPLFPDIRYVVQPGDTPFSIAAQFQVPLQALEERNVLFAAIPGLVISVPPPVRMPPVPMAPAGFPACRPAPFGERLQLGDDDSQFVAFPQGFTFPFFGRTFEGVFVNSNGNLTFEEGDPSFFPTTDAFVEGPPRIAALWSDLLPVFPQTTPGGVFVAFDEVAGMRRMVVTWDRVPYFFAQNQFQTFQISLHADGTIAFCYFEVSPPTLEGLRALIGVGGGRQAPRGNVFSFDGETNPRRLGPDEPTPPTGLSGRILVYRFDPAIANYRLRFTT